MQLLPPPPAQAPAAPGTPATPQAPGNLESDLRQAAEQLNQQIGTGRPLTPAEIASIRARRSELSSQLTSATDRRNELAQQLEGAEGANRVGLEQRLAVLDKRIVQLESDIAETGRQLTAPRYTTSTGQPSELLGMSQKQTAAVSIVFTLFVLAPISLAMARLLWKRAIRSGPVTDAVDITRRLIGLEQSIEAIAVEVERVSEGQRYVTKIINEARGNPALMAGQAPAEPVRIDQGGRVAVPRNER
jgi:hypothetical protein